MSSVLLSTSYMPTLQYLTEVIKNEQVYIETSEHYVKQTNRNRCDILTSNGKLTLSIPLIKSAEKEIISNKRISYSENWQQQHWRSITSSYKNAAYFEFFEHEFKPFYHQRYDLLIDYNTALLKTILSIFRLKKIILNSTEFELLPTNKADLRDYKLGLQSLQPNGYKHYQVFIDKFNFTPQLSCIDALFNCGLDTLLFCGK